VAAELIGPCRCPLCGGKARLTLAKSQLAVITCNGCNFQGFARSDRSDELLRGMRLAVDAAPVATVATSPAGTSEAAAPAPVRTDPLPAPVRTGATPPTTSQPAPAKPSSAQRAARSGWLGLNL